MMESNPAGGDLASGRELPKSSTGKFPLQPGFGDRLRQLLDEARLPRQSQVSFLCRETGRSKQTVHRWLSASAPGNPDLESLALICLLFQIDANWLLGLTQERLPMVEVVSTSLSAREPDLNSYLAHQAFSDDVVRQVALAGPEIVHLRMVGDDMEPRIKDGAMLSVDSASRTIDGNGIYVLNYQGRRIVRIVEQRVGEGVALLCENRSYREVVVPQATELAELGLAVVGRVVNWLQVNTP